MLKSVQLFLYYFNEALSDIKNNFKIYFIYIITLCFVSIVQNCLDYYVIKDILILKIISKTLFSIVPILILCKILYVIKIRHLGIAEYGQVIWNFLIYNIYYFFLLLIAALLYFFSAMGLGSVFTMKIGFISASFLLIPLFYIMIYYSLSPFVAVFETEEVTNVFSKSKMLSGKNIYLVIINHICSLLIPGFFSLSMLITNPQIKFITSLAFSIPEGIFSILMILTTAKIYIYLKEKE